MLTARCLRKFSTDTGHPHEIRCDFLSMAGLMNERRERDFQHLRLSKAYSGVAGIQPSKSSLMRCWSWRFFCSLLRSRSSRSLTGAPDAVMVRKASPTLLACRQINGALHERHFRGMFKLISSGSFAALSNSTQAPCSPILRTTQSIVEPDSLIAATPPKMTLLRTP